MTQTADRIFHLTYREEGIAVITMDVPGEKMNVLRTEYAQELETLLYQIKTEATCRGVILTSAKPDCFIAGADIQMLDRCRTAQQAQLMAQQGQALFDTLERFPIPIVAAIQGVCLGGGLELALACHARFGALDDKTVLALPEVRLGLLPGSGGTQRLPRLIGYLPALEMMLTGKNVKAKSAAKSGLLNAAVPPAILLQAAAEWILAGHQPIRKLRGWQSWLNRRPMLPLMLNLVRRKTLQQTKGHYPAPGRILDVVAEGLKKGRTAGLSAEAKAFGELVMTPESAALRHLFFATTALKKAEISDTPAHEVQRMGVLGGGLMGSGIAYLAACKQGAQVRIKEITPAGITGALRYSWALLQKQIQRRRMTPRERDQQMAHLSGGVDYQGFQQVDMVIEAVFEDIALKRSMVAEVEQVTGPRTIFASNTSSLPIERIAEGARRPQQIIGLHFFSPADKMPLVEVIPHAGTDARTIATAVDVARRQGKTPIVVADKAGFYVNRILAPYINEAMRCLLAGEPIEAIDHALTRFGFPVGPITLLDEVGIDVGTKIIPILTEALGERFRAPEALEAIIRDGRSGRKNRRGFYLYSSKRRGTGNKKADPSLYALLGVTPKSTLSAADIAERCVLMMLNEAARCLEEQVIKTAFDGDIGAVFGIGFPPFLGGPFHYMDSKGIDWVVEQLESRAEVLGERFKPCVLLRQMAEEQGRFYPLTTETTESMKVKE